MSASRASLRAPAPVTRWLAGKAPAERRALIAIAVAVTTSVVWLAVWQPLERDAARLRATRDASASALATARRMTEEIAAFKVQPQTTANAEPRANLERILGQQKLGVAPTQLDWQNDQARVVFASIGYTALVAALEALQRDAQLRVVAATLTARVEPGMVRADITLAR